MIEKVSQSQEIAYVVNTETGELKAQYQRDPRKMSQTATTDTANSSWRDGRKLKSIEDVKSVEDLYALIGDYSASPAVVTQQGIGLLLDPRSTLSKTAMVLATQLIHKKLVARNYAIVSNDEIQQMTGDESGNYTRYMRQLEQANFCRTKSISKELKLVEINPAYGYRGWLNQEDGVPISAFKDYYFTKLERCPAHLYFVKNYEDGMLEAA